MDCAVAVWVLALFLMSLVPSGCQAAAPTAINISVCLLNNRQEASITCAYISFPPVHPRVKVNDMSYTVRTLNDTPTLNIYDSYNDFTMENVFTIVLHNPRMYVDTVFECYFLLNGGGVVSSGPAGLTLTPMEEFNASLCSAEDAHASIPSTLQPKLPTSTGLSKEKTIGVVVTGSPEIQPTVHVTSIPTDPSRSSTQMLSSKIGMIPIGALGTGQSPDVSTDPLTIVGIVLGIVLVAVVTILLLSVILVVRAKKNKCRQKTPTNDDNPPLAQGVPITKNPSYEPVELGSSFSSSCGGSHYCKREVTARSGLPRESYDNVQLKNVAVIPSSCKPLSVAPRENDYQQPASWQTTGVGAPLSEVHAYEEVDLKRSHTVIPSLGLGHTYGNVNPKQEASTGEKTTTVIFTDSDSPKLGMFGPRRATTAACYHGEGKPHTPALPDATMPQVATHHEEHLPLRTLLGKQAEASEDQAPCLDEYLHHDPVVACDEDVDLDEYVPHDPGIPCDEDVNLDEYVPHDPDVAYDEDVDLDEYVPHDPNVAYDEDVGLGKDVSRDRRSKTSDSGAGACYDYI